MKAAESGISTASKEEHRLISFNVKRRRRKLDIEEAARHR
jgi:hypothetical protein